MDLFKASGMPTHCVDELAPIEWIGTPAQQKALAELHDQLCAYLATATDEVQGP
jgi:hypothetical protein